MVRTQQRGGRLLRIMLAGVLGLAGISGGCARPYRTSHSGYGVGLFLPPHFAPRQSNPSTLGADLLKAPRGQTIPPPSLGVDLVDYRPNTDSSSLERAAGSLRTDRGQDRGWGAK